MIQHAETNISGLRCRIVDNLPADTQPDLLVVLCHGYGAPGDDLVDLGSAILRSESPAATRTRFVFPEAPHSADGDPTGFGRAWWQIDLMALQMALATGQARLMADQTPEGLAPSRRKLRAVVEQCAAQAGLPLSKVLLGGFSQGAMLTCDLALRLEEAPAGLALMSGTLLSQDEWQKQAPKRAGLDVMQSHGRFDPLLPFAAAESLRDLLVDNGLNVEFVPFDGEHTIMPEAFGAFVRLVERKVAPDA